MADFQALAREISEYDERTLRKLKRDINAIRQELGDLLDDFANKDDSINQRRLGRLLSELDSLMAKQSEVIFDDTTEGMSLAAKATALFLVTHVNDKWNQYVLNVQNDLAMRKWLNDLSLWDRSRIISGRYGDEIRSIIRQGVYQGVSTSRIRRQVREIYEGTESNLDRLVVSEIQNTYRLQFGHTNKQNGQIWIQFNEHFPASKNRRNHECYEYAREDPYGKGPGIFKVDDEKIYSPHPQCTSYLSIPSFVLGGEA
ncbi:hypothetical protein P4631_08970 [Halalkalibacterium halodurans]|uniref:hypothetical protein n=1 Tax=Halalkalibacterium halodurans TaxID=86665 RepID=UPI002E212439|nr:hypothetical protein [Halalkalibacterium halodurans]